jgi:hypothetical protein
MAPEPSAFLIVVVIAAPVVPALLLGRAAMEIVGNPRAGILGAPLVIAGCMVAFAPGQRILSAFLGAAYLAWLEGRRES